jgi:Lrp/AsnC family transcriptional regulator, leucine-responsive regulatory protein
MDATDLAIVELLQRDGRLANKTLAERVGLSASACLERVRKLERDGVIARYAAVIDKSAFGASIEGWVTITIADRTASRMAAVGAALAEAEIVIAAYELAAPYDVLAHVVAPDLECWRTFESELERKLGLVGSVRMGIVTRVIKPKSPVPTRRLTAPRR